MNTSSFPLYNNSVVNPVSSTVAFYYNNTDDIISSRDGKSIRGRYGRYHNNNWIEVEKKLARLDECEEALLFPSGMSAISSLMMCFTKVGDSIIYSKKCYRNIKTFFELYLSKQGINIIHLDQTTDDSFYKNLEKISKNDYKIFFVEMPSNPHLHMVDLSELRKYLGKECLIVVDSTLASPINIKPVRYGADLIVHSCTKYLGGHADIMAGSVAGPEYLISKLRAYRNVVGSIASPSMAALLNRSLETLRIRVTQSNQTGMEVATYLEDHPRVKKVFYTGLKSHPDYNIAKKYLSGHGGVITFELDATEKQTSEFIDAMNLPFIGTHFGSYHAMIEQLGLFTYYQLSPEERIQQGITDSMIRLSIGLYSPSEILEDLNNAFQYIFDQPDQHSVLKELLNEY